MLALQAFMKKPFALADLGGFCYRLSCILPIRDLMSLVGRAVSLPLNLFISIM